MSTVELWLRQLADAPDDEPCRGVWSVAVLSTLGMDADSTQVNRRKLAGRRSADVRSLITRMQDSRQEEWQGMLTDFAKKNKAGRVA